MAINMALPGELYFNTTNKKQEELGEGQKEERLERGGTSNHGGREQKNHMEE